MKGFKKCCISRSVERTDDDMLWKGSVEDGDVRSECEEDDCEDGDSDTDWYRQMESDTLYILNVLN